MNLARLRFDSYDRRGLLGFPAVPSDPTIVLVRLGCSARASSSSISLGSVSIFVAATKLVVVLPCGCLPACSEQTESSGRWEDLLTLLLCDWMATATV